MSGITRIPNIEHELVNLREWTGWITGWYNPFGRLGDVINPAELGTLVTIQGEYLQKQGQLVQELGGRLTQLTQAANLKGPAAKG